METKGRPFVYAPRKKDDRRKSRMKLIKLINDKKQITGKKSIISACNLSYRLKRSGPYVGTFYKMEKKWIIFVKIIK